MKLVPRKKRRLNRRDNVTSTFLDLEFCRLLYIILDYSSKYESGIIMDVMHFVPIVIETLGFIWTARFLDSFSFH